MPVELPDLTRTRCHYLTLCGKVGGELPVEVPAVFATGRKWHVAEYEAGGMKMLVRCGWDPPVDGQPPHLHFDLTSREHFERRGRPVEATIALAEIDRLVGVLGGREYKGFFDGYFGVPPSRLPQPVQSLVGAARVEDGEVRTELTVGTLLISGKGPLSAIRWEKDGHPAGYKLTLTGRLVMPVGDRMLTEAAGLADKWFGIVCSAGEQA